MIAYSKIGSGSIDIVAVHGFGASSEVWNSLVDRIPAELCTFYLVDLVGHGQSPLGSGDHSIEANARALGEVIDSLGLKEYLLLGHSYGGLVSLLFAMDYAANGPAGLILIGTPAYKIRLPLFVSALRIPYISALAQTLTPASVQVWLTLLLIYFDWSKINHHLVEKYARPLRSYERQNELRKTAKEINLDRYSKYVSKYSQLMIPTLLIGGERDPVVPVGLLHKFANVLPSAKLEMIPRCGHNVPEECPAEAVEFILQFLREMRR